MPRPTAAARPCADAAIVDDTMSPAPMPAAATSSPGPINRDDAGRGCGGVLRLHRPPPGVPLIYAPMTSTAAATARVLADAGIERVFGLPGGEVLVLMDELRRAGVDFVLMRHEANAGIAAAVYGKLRRQPGVVLTTLGPGAANLMLPMSNAYLDLEPLLAISAQIPDDFPAEPHAPAAAAARRLPADRALRREDHRRERARRGAAGAGRAAWSARSACRTSRCPLREALNRRRRTAQRARSRRHHPRAPARANRQLSSLAALRRLEASARRDWARRRPGERGARSGAG